MTEALKHAESADPQYVTLRDHGGKILFYEDSDYRCCLARLRKAVTLHGSLLHAYALVPDHVELLVSSPHGAAIAGALESLMREYAEYFNFKNRRILRPLAPVYTAASVETGRDLLAWCRYIELVPVRLRLAAHPSEYPWSSHASNALGEDTGLVHPHGDYLALGGNEFARRERYRGLFEDRQAGYGDRRHRPPRRPRG